MYRGVNVGQFLIQQDSCLLSFLLYTIQAALKVLTIEIAHAEHNLGDRVANKDDVSMTEVYAKHESS